MQKILPVILSLGLASLSINAKATELTNLTELNLNTQLSLESKASAQGTDVTLVCFITDTSKCTGYEFGMNNKERCCAEGYCQDACEFPKVPTATCPYDSGYVSGCQCPSDYVKCLPGEIGIGPSCDGKYRECRSDACSGYRYAPSSSECPYGYTVDETPFGSACYHCRSCNRLPDETNCPYGTTIASDGCGGTRTVCAACTPKPDVDPDSCPYGVENEDDGCGSTHMVCKGCVMGGDEGCKGQSEPCAPNQKQEICKDCTGMNRYICTDKDDTCPFGSKKTCGENEIQIGSAVTEAGSACAVCRPKTCEDAGLMSTKPEGQVCSTTTYAGQTCYLDCQ